jgi:hypothetical protein
MAMRHAFLVRGFECFRYLTGVVERRLDPQRPAQ